MEYLNTDAAETAGHLNRHNFGLDYTVQEYPREYQHALRQALVEAWMWLEREGLLIPKPGTDGHWMVISRRGRQMQTRKDVDAYREANRFPRQELHPTIAQKVWAPFLRGDYDTAVFQAFKEVEVKVREAGQFTDAEYGTRLMRRAFDKHNGPLADMTAPEGERDALCNLFAGAIGCYKNPHSHRNVSIAVAEAVEMIVLASHLLGIAERRAAPESEQAGG